MYAELAAYGIHEGVTPALASQVARWSVLLPSYEAARRELEQAGVSLNVKVVHRIARQVGAEVLTTRTRDLERYRRGELPIGTELRGKRVAVALDGGRIRIRRQTRKVRDKRTGKKRRVPYQAEWREPKLLIIFELDARGRMRRGTRPWIDGTFAGPDELIELLAMHLHRLGAAQAKQVVFLADGAPWIWERLEWVPRRVGVRPERVQYVLDFCHAVHHVSLALELLELSDPERQRRYRQLRGWLRAGRWRRIIDELAQWGRALPGDSDYWTRLSYLERHGLAGHLAYTEFRRRGVPLGSGAIESAIRRVVNLRLKGNGLTWYEQNAEAALVLRAAALSDRWDETLEHARATTAARRQLDWRWQTPDLVEQLKSPDSIQPPAPQPPRTSAPTRAAA